MNVAYWNLDESQLTGVINTVKDALLERMQSDGIITHEQAEDVSKKYICIIKKPNILSKFFKSRQDYVVVCSLSQGTIKNFLQNDNEE